MLGLKVNNLAEAINHSRRLETIDLKQECDRLDEQSKKYKLNLERQKAAFSHSLNKKHQVWWNADDYVRNYFKLDFESVLAKRLKERIKSEYKHKSETQKLPAINNNTNHKKSFTKNKSKQHNNAYQQDDNNNLNRIRGNEVEKQINKVSSLKFPELKNKLIDQYNIRERRKDELKSGSNKSDSNINNKKVTIKTQMNIPDRKSFIECAERFLVNKPFTIENKGKLSSDEESKQVKEKFHEKEKDKLKSFEDKFGDILKSFHKNADYNNNNNNNSFTSNSYNSLYD